MFQSPSAGHRLRQGDLLGGLIEHALSEAAAEIAADTEVGYFSVERKFAIVLTSDCDLERDYEYRFKDTAPVDGCDPSGTPQKEPVVHQTLLVVCADVPTLLSQLAPGKDIKKRVMQNQDERYHLLKRSNDVAIPDLPIDEFVCDFRKTFGIPTFAIYRALALGTTRRLATLESPFLYDFMHRAFGYLSRIGVPEMQAPPVGGNVQEGSTGPTRA